MIERRSTRSNKFTKPGRVAAIGFIASAIFVGLAPEAQAGIFLRYGDLLCHATASGPQYYYSRIEPLSIGSDDPEWLLFGNTDEARRLERRTLDQLTGEFARHVAEHHEIDALTLLFPHCEVTKPGAAAAGIEEAAYFRDGEFVFYETSEKIAVDWVPAFHRGRLASSQELANAAVERAALVVGNGAYSHAQALVNPTNDAGAVGAALKRLGFDVTTVLDASRGRLAQALREFEMHAARADMALVFYAGHGLEVGGSHYVVPVDARLQHRADLSAEAMAVDRVIQSLTGARARIVILDACRHDPFPSYPIVRNVVLSPGAHGVGSQPVASAVGGLLIAYSASSGTCPDDGPAGGNSPYTQALLEQLEESDDEIVMLRRVAASVLAATEGRQRPAVYSTLAGDVYLKLE